MGIEMTDLEDTKNNAGVADKPQFSGEWVRLGDVATYVNGYAFKPTDYASEGKPIIRIQDLTGNAYQTNRFAGVLDDKYRVGWGDVLISWSASLGVYEWGSEEAWLNQHIFKVQFNKLPVNKRFFIHQARYVIAESTSLAHGATMRHLTKKVFDNLPFFYPSEHDQDEIACRLDGVQLQIDSAREVIARLDDLVKSRFSEMFENEKQIVRLCDVCDTFNGDRGSNYPSADERLNAGIPFINAGNLVGGTVSFNDMEYVSEEKYLQLTGGKIQSGDLLYCLRGSLGKNALTSLNRGTVASSLMIIRCKQGLIKPQYLYMVMNSPSIKRQVTNANNGSSQPNLSARSVKQFSIPLPPLFHQQEFSAFFSQVDKLRFKLLANPSPAFGGRSFCCSTKSGNGGVILDT